MATTSYHIKPDYSPRLHEAPVHYADGDSDIVGRPDVYNLCRDLARETGCRRVIDLGCRRACSLSSLYPEFAIVGMDVGANLDHCRAHYPFGTWLEADFEVPKHLNFDHQGYADSAIICADLIQRLVDPTGLMMLLRRFLFTAPFALLTTPERDLTHGPDHQGPPPDKSHVREWNFCELRRYAAASLLDIGFAGLTASRSRSFPLETSLLLLCGYNLSTGRRRAIVLACNALRGYDALARERDTLIEERDAARAETNRLAGTVAQQQLDFHRMLLRRLVAQIRRGGISSVVLIGAGKIGRLAMGSLTRAGVCVVSVGDDDPRRWENASNDLCVVSVDDSLNQSADAVVIASLGHERELRQRVRSILARRSTRLPILSLLR